MKRKEMSKTLVFDGVKSITVKEEQVPHPQHDQVLVQMKACGICQLDIKCFSGKEKDQEYLDRPGHEGVGVVVETGTGVKDIKPGDKITTIAYGGSLSEHFAADRNKVEKIPDDVKNYELWISEPVACTVSALRQLRIEPGDDVVVLGSGYMGLLLIQGLPKEYLGNLIAIDIDKHRLELAKKYGATAIIDPADLHPCRSDTGDLRLEPDELANAVFDITGRKIDLVIEAVGKPGVIVPATKMLRNGGKLCIFGHHVEDEKMPTGSWHMQGLIVLNTTPYLSPDFSKDLVDAVKLMRKKIFDQTELITHRYNYKDVVNAFEEVSGHPQGLMKSVLVNY
jgi:threonine dehydrogenase-like Zn-dependent dehydrogenase